jgi:predicted amidohydrolase YtcJ
LPPRQSCYVLHKPTGYILEVAAILQVVNAVDPISRDAMQDLLEGWLAKASAAGITTVYDAGVPPIGEDQGAILSIYTDLEEQKRLPFRVVASFLVNGPLVRDATASVQDLARRIDTELVQARAPSRRRSWPIRRPTGVTTSRCFDVGRGEALLGDG